jgi:hypothetical protein
MSEIRTLSDLSDYIFAEKSWRFKELSQIKLDIDNHSGKANDVYLRCGIAILYAHWEGFVKNASLAYLEYISYQRHRYDELAPNIVSLALKKELDAGRESNKTHIY